MIQKTGNVSYEMSDSAISEVLGAFIRETRLRQNRTQQEVAEAAGIRRMTLVRFEKDGNGTMATFIRLLRTLQQLHMLDGFVLEAQISPLRLAKIEKESRQRARPEKRPGKGRGNDKQSDW